MSRSLAIVLIIFGCASTWSQRLPDPSIAEINAQHGLTSNDYHYFIDRDSRGFLWISSTNGLYRFDGTHAKRYGPAEGMKGANIQSNILEDARGQLWFSTTLGLNRYDPAQDSMFNYPLIAADGDTLKRQESKVVTLDHDRRRLWLKIRDSLCYVSTAHQSRFRCTLPTIGFDFHAWQRTPDTLTLFASPWWEGRGVEVYHLVDSTVHRFGILPSLDHSRRTFPLETTGWVVHQNTLSQFTTDASVQSATLEEPPVSGSVFDAVSPSPGTVLIGTRDAGSATVEVHTAHHRRSLFRTQRPIYWLQADTQYVYANIKDGGVLWTAHRASGFETILPSESSGRYLVTPDRFGGVNINTPAGKIYRWSSRPTGLIPVDTLLPKVFLVHTNDRLESVYLTRNEQLFVVPYESDRAQRVATPEGISFFNYGQLTDGRQLLGTSRGMQELIRDRTGRYRLQPLAVLADAPNSYSSPFFPLSNHRVYFQGYRGGLDLFSTRGGDLVWRGSTEPTGAVFQVSPSRRSADTLWVASTEGLRKLYRDTLLETPRTQHRGIITETIFGVVETDDGTLWLTSERGLLHWNPRSDVLLRYLTSDGIAGDKFHYQGSIELLPDGRIVLATNRGITRFHPDSIRSHRTPPRVHLESLVVNDQRRIRAPGFREGIDLDYFENNLLFEPIPVTLFRPELARVRYQMEGYDDRPVEIERGQRIRYVRMPPGHYTFRIRAVDDNGNRSDWLRLPVRIRPPWWQTWWFYTLVTLTLSTLGFLMYRRRIRHLRREEATKRELLRLELAAAENELTALRAQMNPHFLFNVMNSIKSIIITKQTDRAIHYLTQLSQLIRTILANSERKTIPLDRELAALKIYVQLEALRFDDDFDYSVLLGDAVDTDFVKIPPLILQPFAENAIRHGLVARQEGQRRLNLHIYRAEDFVVFEMEDNGIGRAAAAQSARAGTEHKSMGLDITRRRLKMAHARNDFRFVDLTDAEKRPLGTRVIVRVWAPD